MDKSTRDRLCSTIVSDLLAFPHLSFNDYLSQLLFAESRRAALATQHARNLVIAKENHDRNVAIVEESQTRQALIAQEIAVIKLIKSGGRLVQTKSFGDGSSSEHVTQLKVGNNPNITCDDLITTVLPSYPHLKLFENMPKTDIDTELLHLIRSYI